MMRSIPDQSSSSTATSGTVNSDLVAARLAQPCEVVLDLDGTLLSHDLSQMPDLQREMLQLVIQAFKKLQGSHLAIATNKTFAEVCSLGISDSILFTENCSSLFFPKELSAQIAVIFPEATFGERSNFGMVTFGGDLSNSIERAASLLRDEFGEQLSGIFGRHDWQIVAAANALDPRYPDVVIEDVQESFGLTEESARDSAARDGNSGIFVKTNAADLIPFDQALGRVVTQFSAVWQEICARGDELGILLTPSSKAVSVTSARMVKVRSLSGDCNLVAGKGLAIELQRSLSGGRPLFFAGDAANDISAVERLLPADTFCQMKSKNGDFDQSLVRAAISAGCAHYLCPDAAPLGIAKLSSEALALKIAGAINPDAEQLRELIVSKLSCWHT